MKAISESFRCDLCGRFSNLGVTETYNVGPGKLRAANTVCVRCISNATRLLFDGLLVASGDDRTSTPESSSE